MPPATVQPRTGPAVVPPIARRERRTQGQGREGCCRRGPVGGDGAGEHRSCRKAGKGERHRRRDRRRPGCAGGKPPTAAATPAAARMGQGPEGRAIHSAASARAKAAALRSGERSSSEATAAAAPRASKGTRAVREIGGGYRSARQPPGAGGKEQRGAEREHRGARGGEQRQQEGADEAGERQQRQALRELARRGEWQAERHRPSHRDSQCGAERGEVAAVQEAQQPGPGRGCCEGGERGPPGGRERREDQRASGFTAASARRRGARLASTGRAV